MESKDIVIDFFNEAKDKLNLKEENKDGFLELMNDPNGRLEVFNLSKEKLGLSSFEVFEDVLGYKEKSEGGDENISEDPKDVEDNIILTNNNPEELKKEIGVQSVAATVAPETDGALEESSIEQQNLSPENQEKSKEGTTEVESKKKLHIEKIRNIVKGLDSGLLKIKDLQVYTGNSPDKYGYLNRGDGSGQVELTKFEYDNLIEGKDPYTSEIDKTKEETKPVRVTQEEVSMDEQDLVPMLTKKLKGTNFKVEEAIPGADGIKITNTVTNQEEVFSIDAFTGKGDIEYANKINKWVEGQEKYSKGISEQKTIDETRKKKNDDYYNSLSLEEKGAIDLKVAKKIYETKPDGSIDRTKKLSTEEEKKEYEEEKQRIVENLDGFDRLGIAFRTGTQQAGMSITSIPESIYNVFSIPQNVVSYLIDDPTLQTSAKRFKEKYDITNVALESYKEERENLQKLSRSYDINTYKYQGVGESISNGEYLDAFAKIGNGLAESAPVSMSIMAGASMTTLPQLIGGSTVALMGSEVMEQEEKNPDQNPLFATIKGMGIAAAETFFSAINAKSLTFVYKDILLREGKKIAETTLRRGLLEMYQAALKKYGFPVSALGEGFEEILTLQTQNIINRRPLNEGVTDAFILGITGGTMYGAPINAINFANKVPGLISGNEVGKKLKNGGFPSAYDALLNDKEVTENVVDVINVENSIPAIDNKLDKEVSNNEITEEESESAKKKARQIQGVLNSLKSLGLNDAQTLIATNLIIEKSNLKDIIKKVGDSALTTKESDRIKEINEEISNIRTKTPEDLAQERLEKSLEKEVVDGVESIVSEDIITKEDVDIYTGNSPERYGSYAAGDGSGRVDITEEEYNALPDTLNDVTTNEQTNINNKAAEDVSKGNTVVKEGLKNLMNAMSSVFGLNSTQATASSLIQDAIVATMAKREGISKEEMYEKIIFDKAEKAPDGSLKQEPLIFKSTAKEGLSKLPNNPMTPEAWVKQITEKGGKGTSQELNWIGLNDFLQDYKKENNLKSIPKEVVEQYIADNQIEIVEVTKGGEDVSKEIEKLKKLQYRARNNNDYNLYQEQIDKIKETKYSDYTLEGGENYREVLLTLPSQESKVKEVRVRKSDIKIVDSKTVKGRKEVIHNGNTLQEFDPKEGERANEGFIYYTNERGEFSFNRQDLVENNNPKEYKSSHWDEANILSHLRINERTLPNGERVMFIEEIQSDWAQDGKKEGFKDESVLEEKKGVDKKIDQIRKEVDEIADESSNIDLNIESIEMFVKQYELKTKDLLNEKIEELEERLNNARNNKQYTSIETKLNPLKERLNKKYPLVERVTESEINETREDLASLRESKKALDKKGNEKANSDEFKELKNKQKEFEEKMTASIPNMPYKKTDQWVGMAMRRVMQMAAQEGFDRVAWVTGEQSADRYDLSKQVDRVEVADMLDGNRSVYISMKDNSDIQLFVDPKTGKILQSTDKGIDGKMLEDVVGKEISNKILNLNTEKESVISGEGLKIGGKGMKDFYNSILPKVAKKEAQRFDKEAKVEDVDVSVGKKAKKGDYTVGKNDDGTYNVTETNTGNKVFNGDYNSAVSEKNRLVDTGFSKQLSIPITPKMRMNLNGAVPLFQGARGAMTAADGQFVLYALTDPNVSTPVHEMAHVFEHYLTDQERNDILDWAGHTNWTTETSEKFARGFEKYLAGGKVSNPKLQEAFEQFKEWLTEIYNNIVGSDIDVELNEKMSNLYDSMLEDTVEETVEETTPEEESIDMGESTKRFVNRVLNEKIFEPIRIAFQDKWYSLSKLQKIAARDGYINPKDDLTNIYLEKELEAGIVKQRIQNIIETIEGSKTFQGKSTFERMYKDGVNIDQLGLYMFAKHAQERNEYLEKKIFKELESLEKEKEKAELNRNTGIAEDTQAKINAMKSDINSGKLNTKGLSGMTNEQANEIIKEVQSSGFTDKFDEYSKELREKLVDASLQLKVDYGLISESKAKTISNDWEFYVPLYVDEDSFEGGNYRSSTGKKGTGLYKLKGSDFYGVDKRVNPITGMIVQATAAAKKAQANQVFNATFNLATKLNEENVTNIFGKPRKATGDDKSIKSQGKVYVGYVDGVETAIEIKDEKIQKAFEDKVYTPSQFAKVVMFANNYLRMVNTLINPEFQLTNFVRDVQTAFINISAEDASKMNTKMLKNVPNAMKGIFTNELGISNKWSDIYQDLKESGGDVSWVQLLDMEAIKNRVNKATESYKKSKTERNLKLLLKAGEQIFQATTKSTEMASRLSAYKVALDAGYTKKQASSLAKNLTVNFEKKGTGGIVINTLYLFANAGIQGSTLVLRAMTKSGAGGNRARTIAGAIIGLSIMNSYINKQMGLSDEDKEEDKTPEYTYLAPFIKNSNMVFMTPEVAKDGNYKASAVTIPLPYGYNVLWSIGQNAADVMDGTVDFGEGLMNTTESFLGAFNPRGASPLIQQIFPTFLQPIAQNETNKDWMGNPLFPEQANRLKSQSYYKSATEASKITANYINSLTGGSSVEAGWIDVSPEVLDNAGSFAIGGLGRFIKQTYNSANDFISGEEIDLNSTPFVRKVYKPAYENRHISYIYKYLEDPMSKNEKQKKAFKDALSAYEKKEKEKIMERHPTGYRGDVIDRGMAEEDLEDKILGFERAKYLAEKKLYWEKKFKSMTTKNKLVELIDLGIKDDEGNSFELDSWNNLQRYRKDEKIRDYSEENAKKSWKSWVGGVKYKKYQKYKAKEIGIK